MHLKLPDGSLVSGNGVFPATLSFVRGFKWLGRLAERFPAVRRVLAWKYGFVARRREFFSRLVPDRPAVIEPPELR